MYSFFTIEGWWAAREENSENLARRLEAFFLALAAIGPRFGSWTRGGMRHRSSVPRDFDAPGDLSELRQWLEENPRYKARDGRKAFSGYHIYAHAVSQAGEPDISFRLMLTATEPTGFSHGNIYLTVFYPETVDRLKLRNAARPMLLALAQAWDATWAGVEADDYCVTGGPPRPRPLPWYRGGQMIYLTAEKAKDLDLPAGLEAEKLPDAGLVLTATDMLFDRRNALHREAAARIQVALDPLNRY